MKDFVQQKINIVNVITLIKAFIFSLFLGEFLFIGIYLSQPLIANTVKSDHEYLAIFICGIYLLLLCLYSFLRNLHEDVLKFFRSYRFDIFFTILLGLVISISFGGFFSVKYQYVISLLTNFQIILLSSTPIFLGFLLILLNGIQLKLKRSREEFPFFISDKEKGGKSEDLLNLSQEATRFAERVFNGGSTDSVVFGIDAPWGIGKSSFVNFCAESWEKEAKYHDKIIIYRFNPLRYEDRSNLLEKFIDGLVQHIQKHQFAPEIRPLVSRYSRLIKGKGKFSIGGLNIELTPGEYTIDDAFDDLEEVLLNLNKKIIVVVDDLDRLNFSAVKDVLFAIKKSFTLPNISYVLCYDTENILDPERKNGDAEKVREFLEKFINVKISILLDPNDLSSFISDNLKKALESNLQLDPYTIDKIKQAVEVIKEIYKSPKFHNYRQFIGDIRKLKRLLNTLVLFEIEKTNFEDSDFDRMDLIHLLLIYINYPNVFRKIYDTETHGRREFFSVLVSYDNGYPGDSHQSKIYKNSQAYEDYLKSLPPNQQFLLNQIFNVSIRFKDANIDNVPEEQKKSYACFNGGPWGGGKNLEEYLNLIVKLAKPQRRGQYKFYLNSKNKVANEIPIEKVLSEEEFSYLNSENSHEQFWRVVVNASREFKKEVADNVIRYLLDNSPNYSFFTNEKLGLGLRDDIDFFIVKLLNDVGWVGPNGKYSENTEENIMEIAEWVFGEGKHLNEGVLEKISAPTRGILGFYDLLAFRLFCSADRGGDIFNLHRALSKHGSSTAPTQGSTHDIAREEMREISQKVFRIFRDQYITSGKNIFDEIDNLPDSIFFGKYDEFVKSKIKSKEISQEEIDDGIAELKHRMKSFITYQLGNTIISHGIGCGYYDETGNADKRGVAQAVNNYFFNKCFNPKESEENYEHFLDYLLGNLGSSFASEGGRNYKHSINEFNKVLDRNMLAQYWKANSKNIKDKNFINKDKNVITANYTASYKKDLNKIYELLDTTVEDIKKEEEAK